MHMQRVILSTIQVQKLDGRSWLCLTRFFGAGEQDPHDVL
jgi:hypothetical protein